MARRRKSRGLFKLPVIGRVQWWHLALAAGAFYLYTRSQSPSNAIVAANQPAPGWVPGGV